MKLLKFIIPTLLCVAVMAGCTKEEPVTTTVVKPDQPKFEAPAKTDDGSLAVPENMSLDGGLKENIEK